MASDFWYPLWISIQLATTTTVILLCICTPIAWFLARQTTTKWRICEASLMLPLILPPTVVGFYLMWVLQPASYIGKLWYSLFGKDLLFTFPALLIGSIIYSLPFVVHPLVNGFRQLNCQYVQIANGLGISTLQQWRHIIIPLCKNNYLLASALCFIHTLGEFGVVLMIGGSIPYETEVVAIAIYKNVELLNFSVVHQYALILLLFALVVLYLVRAKHN